MASSYLEGDGKSVLVPLSHTVPGAKEPVYIGGWLGLNETSGNSGEEVVVTIDRREYQFILPSSLTVNQGDTVYVTLASVTAHVIPDAAYSTTSGAGKKAFCKATRATDTTSVSGKIVVTGILLPEGV